MKILFILILNLLVLPTHATVKLKPKKFVRKLKRNKESLFFSKRKYRKSRLFNKHFSRLEEIGINLNSKGRCRYFTRRSLLKANNQNDWDCFFAFRGLIRDTRRCLPSFEDLNNSKDSTKAVKGRIRYVGVAPLPYRYRIEKIGEKFILKMKVAYKNWNKLSMKAQKRLRNRFNKGVQFWNDHSPEQYRFDIKLVQKSENPDFVVNAVNKSTRGPYLREHSTYWPSLTFAHEFGHMMGLDDEYDQIFATLFRNRRCTSKSLMCSSRNKFFPDYYWYLIFRRFAC